MNKDFGYPVSAEKYNAIIQATAYVPTENCPRLIPPASACASHFPAEVAPFAIATHRPGKSVEFHYSIFHHSRTNLDWFCFFHHHLISFSNKQKSHSPTPKPKNMHTAMLPFPPPTAPLPALPLQAPPATPRNASHLYGEFSWPSLDICTLLEKLEDVVAEEEQQEEQQEEEEQEDFPSDNNHLADTSIARYGPEDDSVPSQQAVFSDILALLELQVRVCDWIDEVSDHDQQKEEESIYFTASDDDDEFTDAKTDVDVGVGVIHDDEWLDEEDRHDMGELLGWFDGFGEGLRRQMVLVNGRRGGERRVGCVFA